MSCEDFEPLEVDVVDLAYLKKFKPGDMIWVRPAHHEASHLGELVGYDSALVHISFPDGALLGRNGFFCHGDLQYMRRAATVPREVVVYE